MQNINFAICGEERHHESALAVEERIRSFQEVEHALEEAAAVAEAKRCLGCRACIGCGLCKAICEKNAIVFESSSEEEEILLDAVVLTSGATKHSVVIPEKYGSGRYQNLITTTTFEQMTQERGWCGGLVLRLSDGEIPKRIAVIVEPDDEESRFLPEWIAYVQQAVSLMKQRIVDSEMKVFFPRAGAKVSGYIFDPDCSLTGAEIVSFDELEDDKDLTITWASDQGETTETFDLVVLFNGFAALDHARQIVEAVNDAMGTNTYPEWDIEKMTPGTAQVYLSTHGSEEDITRSKTVADEQKRNSNAA